jgi:tetratricopeptide (TPR) repeat protein
VVHGPGGVGKTTLVRAWLSGLGAPHTWVDLSQARTAEAVHHSVAQALGQAPGPQGDPLLAARRGASAATGPIVLDDGEGFAAEAASALAWIDACPVGTSVVLTTRILPDVSAHTVEVLPLSPDAASALFRSRSPVADDAELRALLVDLDHLPLAIELAAGWARIVSPSQLRQRLAARFQILRRRNSESGRHASLEAVLQDSWERLPDELRANLARLWAFGGPFGLEDAERLLTEAGLPLGVLAQLHDHSWLHVPTPGTFRMLTSVRAYVAQHGEPEARQQGMLRLMGHLCTLAEQAQGDGQVVGPMRPHLEIAAASLEDVVAAARVERVLSTLAWKEGPSWSGRVAQMLVRLEGRGPPQVRIGLLISLAQWRQREGDLPAAMPLAEQAVAEAQTAGQPTAEAVAARMLGFFCFLRGDGEGAMQWSAAAAQIAQQTQNPALEAQATRTLAFQAAADGQFARARELAHHAVELARPTGHGTFLASALHTVSHVEALAGRYATARRWRAEAAASAGDHDFAAQMFRHGDLAIAEASGEDGEVERILVQLDDWHQQGVDPVGVALADEGRGRLHARRGELKEAETCLRRALPTLRRQGLQPTALRVELEIAAVRALRGHTAEAEAIFARWRGCVPPRTGEITELGLHLLAGALALQDAAETASRIRMVRAPAADSPGPKGIDRLLVRLLEAWQLDPRLTADRGERRTATT